MPCPPGHPLDPAALHRAFETTYPLSWSHTPLSVAEISRLHGGPATRRSLQLLEQAAAVEPTVTSQFLDSLPLGTSPYQLDRRVKSPESLARKIVDWEIAGQSRPINDLLRYTVLTESPDELVAAACRAVDALNDHGWRVGSAMHSYTEGSRYKGIHAGMATAAGPRIEVQFHSVASVKVKELTTPWYEVERSPAATAQERAEARLNCVEASKTLRPPSGIDRLTTLGGTRVAVNNYSDFRQPSAANRSRARQGESRTPRSTTLSQTTDGIAR